MILHEIEIKSGRLVSNFHYAQSAKASSSRRLVKSYSLGKWEMEIRGRHLFVSGPNSAEYPLMDGKLLLCSMNLDGDVFYFSRFLDKRGIQILNKFHISEFVEMDPNKNYKISNLITDGKITDTIKFGKTCIYVTDATFVLEPLLDINKDGEEVLSYVLYSRKTPAILEKRLEEFMEV